MVEPLSLRYRLVQRELSLCIMVCYTSVAKVSRANSNKVAAKTVADANRMNFKFIPAFKLFVFSFNHHKF